MRGQSIEKKLEKLDGKVLQLTITDTGNSWCFRFTAKGIKAITNNLVTVDVHIKGSLKSFLLLATHNEDPDTLFFNQELSLEGNTEDGLYLRNVLDAMEFNMENHLQEVVGPSIARVAAPLINYFQFGSRLQSLGKSLL
jgi:predicted lipid carrier protein YhbT